MYDVIIVGAGPTGSAAAKRLADSGQKVLLVEKFKMPRNKSCSRVLIKKSMDLVEKYFGQATPDFTTCEPIRNRGMVFTDDKGVEYCFEQEGLNVWRSSFDNWLAGKAMEAGAELRDGTAALSCEELSGIVTVKLKDSAVYEEKARLVIASEGVTGAIKRRLRGVKEDCVVTYQTFNKGTIDLDSHYFYAYLQPHLSEYDAWFNVKDDFLVLGVSVKDINKREYYYSQFIAYMEAHHLLRIHEEIKSEKWLMPRVKPGCPIDYGCGRILFAGENAGFLNPMGEGISSGMESGHCLAEAIAGNGDDLESIYAEYRAGTAALKAYMERQWSFVGNRASTFQHMKR